MWEQGCKFIQDSFLIARFQYKEFRYSEVRLYLLPTGSSILRRKEKQQKERRKKRLLFVARTITHPPGRTVKSYSLDSVALSPRFGKK